MAVAYSSSINELLNDVSSLQYGILSQYVTHYPSGDTIEQPNTFLNTRSVFSQSSTLSIDTELTKLLSELSEPIAIRPTSETGMIM